MKECMVFRPTTTQGKYMSLYYLGNSLALSVLCIFLSERSSSPLYVISLALSGHTMPGLHMLSCSHYPQYE